MMLANYMICITFELYILYGQYVIPDKLNYVEHAFSVYCFETICIAIQSVL